MPHTLYIYPSCLSAPPGWLINILAGCFLAGASQAFLMLIFSLSCSQPGESLLFHRWYRISPGAPPLGRAHEYPVATWVFPRPPGHVSPRPGQGWGGELGRDGI